MGRGRVGSWLGVLAAGLTWPAAARAACSVTQGDFDGNGSQDVRIVGDTRRQEILITDNTASYRVQLDCNHDGDYADPGDVNTGVVAVSVESYDVRGGGVDDITYESGGSLVGVAKSLAVTFGPAPSGGAIVNRLIVRPRGLSGGASLAVDVTGSAGSEEFGFEPEGPLTDSSVVLRGDLGAGQDSLSLSLISLADVRRSSITADLAMGTGNNVFQQTCLTTLDASTLAVNLQGGGVATQSDRLEVELPCELLNNSRLSLTAQLFGGNDQAEVNLLSTIVNPGNEVYVYVSGGAGNDRLAVAGGFPSLIRVDGRLDVAFDGGPGNDLLGYEPQKDVIGDGLTRVQLHGGDGADIVLGAVGADSNTSSPLLDVALFGGRGADTLYPATADPGGGARWGPFGGVQLLGGSDEDVCLAFGEAPAAFHSCEFGR